MNLNQIAALALCCIPLSLAGQTASAQDSLFAQVLEPQLFYKHPTCDVEQWTRGLMTDHVYIDGELAVVINYAVGNRPGLVFGHPDIGPIRFKMEHTIMVLRDYIDYALIDRGYPAAGEMVDDHCAFFS